MPKSVHQLQPRVLNVGKVQVHESGVCIINEQLVANPLTVTLARQGVLLIRQFPCLLQVVVLKHARKDPMMHRGQHSGFEAAHACMLARSP